jgi:hypothetical protein
MKVPAMKYGGVLERVGAPMRRAQALRASKSLPGRPTNPGDRGQISISTRPSTALMCSRRRSSSRIRSSRLKLGGAGDGFEAATSEHTGYGGSEKELPQPHDSPDILKARQRILPRNLRDVRYGRQVRKGASIRLSSRVASFPHRVTAPIAAFGRRPCGGGGGMHENEVDERVPVSRSLWSTEVSSPPKSLVHRSLGEGGS